jgi:predicted Zn-dependent protease
MQALGDATEASRSVERALYLDPASKNPLLYLTAADIMLNAGRAGDAVTVTRGGVSVLGQVIESEPIRVALARALYVTGKPLEALAELDIALAMLPSDLTAEKLRTEIRSSLVR